MKRGACGRRAKNSEYERAGFICCPSVKLRSGFRVVETKKLHRVSCLRETDFRSFRFDLCIPRITQHVSVVEIVEIKSKDALFCMCCTSEEENTHAQL